MGKGEETKGGGGEHRPRIKGYSAHLVTLNILNNFYMEVYVELFNRLYYA